MARLLFQLAKLAFVALAIHLVARADAVWAQASNSRDAVARSPFTLRDAVAARTLVRDTALRFVPFTPIELPATFRELGIRPLEQRALAFFGRQPRLLVESRGHALPFRLLSSQEFPYLFFAEAVYLSVSVPDFECMGSGNLTQIIEPGEIPLDSLGLLKYELLSLIINPDGEFI